MKKILPILFLFLATVATRADLVTATIVITNAPTTNAATLVVNGNTRTWTNNVVNAATQIGTNSTIGGSATNMFNQVAGARFSGVELARSGTNGIVLSGLNMTATVSPGYATVTLVTNTTTSIRSVEVPFSSAYSATGRVGIASLLITGLENTTTAFGSSSTALTNHVALSTAQTISGAKDFTGANTYSNSTQRFDGGAVTNLTSLSASNAIFAGGNLTINTNGEITYATNFIIKYTNGNEAMSISQSGVIAFSDPLQNVFLAYNPTGSSLGIYDTNGSLRIYYDSTQTLFNDTAAASALFIGTNYVRVDSAVLDAPSLTATSGGHILNRDMSDTRYLARAGTNVLDGDISFLRKNNSAIAAGNNAALNVSTNLYTKLAGTSSAFTINGVAGGRDGRWVILQNTNGNIMTIANNSGVDPAATNRILTGTGSDVTVTNNPGFVELLYDSEAARWGVKSKSN